MQCKEGRKGFVEGHTETRGRMKLDMTWYDKVKPNWLSHSRLHRWMYKKGLVVVCDTIKQLAT